MDNQKKIDKAIKNYTALMAKKRAHNDKWGCLKVFPSNGLIDAAFRECARLNCFAELRARLQQQGLS
jgi:hypothetical protein